MSETEPTERDIQRKLFWDYHQSAVLVPNYTPAGWWECDLFRVTKAHYFYEYEIKLSLRDFRADAKKRDTRSMQYERFRQRLARYSTKKYWQLEHAGKRCPSRFYYVVPASIAEGVQGELPSFAGLIVFDRYLREVIKAPRIHARKVSGHVIRNAQRVCVWRYWDALLNGCAVREATSRICYGVDEFLAGKSADG